MRRVILDVDTGVDDAQAIMLALAHPEQMEVLAITCVDGNVNLDQVLKNTFRILDLCGRPDVPVYRGAACPLLGAPAEPHVSVHGADGLGDVPGATPPTPKDTDVQRRRQREHAASAICRLANQYPGEITLVALAPLTNVALAVKMQEDLGSKLKDAIIMGGNIYGRGNKSPAAEFNFWKDPEAAHITLTQLGCPVTLVSWELCLDTALPWEWYDSLKDFRTPKAAFHHQMKETIVARRKNLSKSPHYFTCDPLTVAALLEPACLLATERKYCQVELHGQLTRGQMVVDWNGRLGKDPNVTLVTRFDAKRFMSLFEEMLKQE